MSEVNADFNIQEIEKAIGELVADILEKDVEEIDPDAEFVKDLGMDSMMALEVLAGIEKKFKIVIPEENLPKFTSLNKTISIIVDILKNKKS